MSDPIEISNPVQNCIVCGVLYDAFDEHEWCPSCRSSYEDQLRAQGVHDEEIAKALRPKGPVCVYVEPPMPVKNIVIDFIVSPDGVCSAVPPTEDQIDEVEKSCWFEIWRARAEWMSMDDIWTALSEEAARFFDLDPKDEVVVVMTNYAFEGLFGRRP